MPETEYSIEWAPSGRAKCKRCKEQIPKGELRMVVTIPAESSHNGFEMKSYYEPGCFKIPKKFSSGATKLSAEDFVREHVLDRSDDQSIFPDKLEEITELVKEASAPNKKKRKSPVKTKTESSEPDTIMSKVKVAALSEIKGASTRPTKKMKQDPAESDADATFREMVELYKEHYKKKLDELKDYLRWNRQVIGGTKDVVLFKVLDGMTNGRLGFCPLDGGRLKIADGSCDKILCNGRYDEDNQMRIPCDYVGDLSDPKLRLQPFFCEEPTEEQKEEMDKLQEKAQSEAESDESSAGKALVDEAVQFKWDLSKPAGIKLAAEQLVKLVEGKVDLPEGREPKRLLGQLLMANKEKGPEGVIKEVIAKYGFKEEKNAKAKIREEIVKVACANPKNAPLLLAFQELSKFYFKDGNRNAGVSYQKVVGVLKGMEVEITADNAMSFSKGKTKVPGIGKGSAEKMKEFMETGTIAKLEEKRAAHA